MVQCGQDGDDSDRYIPLYIIFTIGCVSFVGILIYLYHRTQSGWRYRIESGFISPYVTYDLNSSEQIEKLLPNGILSDTEIRDTNC